MLNRHFSLAVSFGVTMSMLTTGAGVPAFANAPPVNTVNNGAIVQSGTYLNTADGKTTFTNTSGGGIWLKSSGSIRGLEVDASGQLTNNGGTIQFYAPGAVVRLDGEVNIQGVQNGNGTFLGNGGKLFVDSAYLYQNGNIYANGINGGLVQFNVGAATFGGTSRIEAKGSTELGGLGGTIAINASGPVDIGRQTVFDSSGEVAGTIDSNVINIEGGLVNVAGNLFANGIDSRGGTIRIVATGQSDLGDASNAIAQAVTAGNFTSSEASTIESGLNSLKTAHDGDIVTAGLSEEGTRANIYAKGDGGLPEHHASNNDQYDPLERGGDGGTIIMEARHDIHNDGWVLADGGGGDGPFANPDPYTNGGNGGNGGTVSMNAGGSIFNTGRVTADGGFGGASLYNNVLKGGDGGLLAFSYGNQMRNDGVISADGGKGANANFLIADGGNGGLVVFSGNQNLTGTGAVVTFGGPPGYLFDSSGQHGRLGTIVAPNPVNSPNTLMGVWQKTQPVELLTHAENLLLLSKCGAAENLFDRMLQANIRSVSDPSGALGLARAEVISKNTGTSSSVFRNLIVGSSQVGLTTELSHPIHYNGGEYVLTSPSPLSNGEAFTTLNTMTILNNGSITTQRLPGFAADSNNTPTDFWVIGRNVHSLGGGRISILANGDINNINTLGTVGSASGGSVNLAASGNYNNDENEQMNTLSTSGDIHGGSIMVKTGEDYIHNSGSYFSSPRVTADGGLMGGTIRLLPNRDFLSKPSDWFTFISANGKLQGGIIDIRAGRDSNITMHYFNNEGLKLDNITANGTLPTEGRGGYVHIGAQRNNIHDIEDGIIEVNGAAQNGTISFTTGSGGPLPNNGSNAGGGAYFNTPGSRTTFTNGLWLNKGDTVRGLEGENAPTQNGGTIQFQKDVVRLDGTIQDASVKDGSTHIVATN